MKLSLSPRVVWKGTHSLPEEYLLPRARVSGEVRGRTNASSPRERKTAASATAPSPM